MIDLDELFTAPAPAPVADPVVPAEEPEDEAPLDDEPAPGQATLFGSDDEFHVAWAEWKGMPEFSQDDLTPVRQILVNFASEADVRAFSDLVGQRFTPKTRSIWYPEAEIGHFADKRYAAPEEAAS